MSLCPFQILELGCPVVLSSVSQKWLFVLLPALAAGFGAWLGQGSWHRIVTAAFFGGLRDFSLVVVVAVGLLVPTNPHYTLDCGVVLGFGCASGAALGACLGPYRGKLLLLLAGFGAFVGQYLLVLVTRQRGQQKAYPQSIANRL